MYWLLWIAIPSGATGHGGLVKLRRFLAPHLLVAIFGSESVISDNASSVLRVVGVGVLLLIPSEILFSAVYGTGDTVATLCIEVLTTTVILVSTYVAAFTLGAPLEVVWMTRFLGAAICLLLSLWWLKGQYWPRLQI